MNGESGSVTLEESFYHNSMELSWEQILFTSQEVCFNSLYFTVVKRQCQSRTS